MARILIIDDEADLLRALTMILKSRGHTVTPLSDAVTATKLVPNEKFDLIISDIRMQPMDGMQFLQFLHQQKINTPLLILTAHATLEVALQAIKNGAFDFITKPFDPETLLEMVQKVLELPAANGADIQLDESVYKKWIWHGIIARSSPMQAVCRSLERIAPTNESVLFVGEEGTGKSFLAGIMHNLSSRSKKKFATFDCAARVGEGRSPDMSKMKWIDLIEQNSGGTVFLENADLLPEPAARELANVIRSKSEKKPNVPDKPDVGPRLLAACRELNESINNLQLFFAFTITLPPLRERRDDILPMIGSIINEAAKQQPAKSYSLSPDAYFALSKYDWPENIHEMRKLLTEITTSADKSRLSIKDLPNHIAARRNDGIAVSQKPSAVDLRGKSFRDYVRRKQIEMKKR